MNTTPLSTVIAGLPTETLTQIPVELLETQVSSVTSDSREVQKNTLFVAIQGTQHDGHDHIDAAVKKGALLVFGEKSPSQSNPPYVHVANSRLTLAHLAANFYGNPSHSMLVIGVTGTSGKTTTTYLLESILNTAQYKTGVIGTVNIRYGKKIQPSDLTTPGPVEIQKLLSTMKAEGCTAVVMEVSSHALKQDRTARIAYDAVIFTNLSPEHQDFHPDMEDYFLSKQKLFTQSVKESTDAGKTVIAAINEVDPYGERLLHSLESHKLILIPFGSHTTLDQLKYSASGISGENFQSHLIGRFNASNILGAIAVAQGLQIGKISEGISALKQVPGRLEPVPNSKGIHVWVDYAHKPEALKMVLETLQTFKQKNRLITVFGCGGDRDRKKRPLMGKYAVELSDFAIITSDNPRTEDPKQIIDEILEGTKGFRNYSVEPDRKKAIYSAIKMARTGDHILIAGKGHEDYQMIADPHAQGKTIKIHLSDKEIAKEALHS